MSEFKSLDAKAPATLEAVVEAVIQLSSQYDEAQLLKLVSDGQLSKVFPFAPKQREIPADFVAEKDLVEASPRPLNRQQRAALIQSSMPSGANRKTARGIRDLPDSAAQAPSKRKATSSSSD